MANSNEDTAFFHHTFTKENAGCIDDCYDMDRKLLGEGSYGQVVKGRCKKTQAGGGEAAVRAIKTIDMSKISDNKRFDQEVEIQRMLDHPHIVKLYEVFKDAQRVYLVMELCDGGELFDRIVEEADRHAEAGNEGQAFDERGGANYMQQILGAMSYLHSHNFVHRDIKPENFLLQNKKRDAPIKIIDFGLAKNFVLGQKELMKTKAGTPYYVAPQVLQGSYDEKCDIWSCGVICYILLCGYPPFYGDSDNEILRRVKKGDFDFPSPDWDHITKDGKDMITKMLTHDPVKRPAASELLEHRWLRDHADKPVGKITTDLSKKLKSFTGQKKLKKIALTVIAQQLHEKDIEELKNTFTLLDKNRDGTLSIQEIREGMKEHKIEIPEDFVSTLNALDTDGSGSIDYSEFIAASMTTKQYMKKDAIWAAFRMFDKDGDGRITKQELKSMLGQDGTGDSVKGLSEELDKLADLMLKEADLDGDGAISWEEFNMMMEENCDAGKSLSL